jgi:hypothetical protein
MRSIRNYCEQLRMIKISTNVPRAETSSEPTQPRRWEKKANMPSPLPGPRKMQRGAEKEEERPLGNLKNLEAALPFQASISWKP